MSEQDHVLGLIDDLLEIVEGTDTVAVDVRADGFTVALRRRPGPARRGGDEERDHGAPSRAQSEMTQVRSPAVGIFTADGDWKVGDRVEQGSVLGGVQSLGHVAEISAPSAGTICEILTASGAPVEYGQPLFSIERS